MMKAVKITYNQLFLVVFIGLFLLHFYLFHVIAYGNHPWAFADWLIHYQDGGLKRRGLSGSFFFLLQDISGLKLQFLVTVFQIVISGFLFYFLYKILSDKKIPTFYIALLFSPLVLLFWVNNPTALARKELLVLTIFCYFFYHISRNSLSKIKEYAVCVMLAVSVFFHEIAFFYVPYFLLVIWIKDDYRIHVSKYIKYIVFTIIPIVILFVFGNEINMGNSLSILESRGVTFSNSKFSIFWWKQDAISIILYRPFNYVQFGFSFTIFCTLYVYFLVQQKVFSYKLVLGFIAAFITTLPLFYLAIDWGRWLFLHGFFMTILLVLFFKNQKKATIKWNQKLLLVAVFLLIYLFAWSMLMNEGTAQGTIIELYELLHTKPTY